MCLCVERQESSVAPAQARLAASAGLNVHKFHASGELVSGGDEKRGLNFN